VGKFLTGGAGVLDGSRDLLIALLHFPYLLGFHPARHIDVDMTKWFASLLRYIFGGKPGGEIL
jgi:hypothetical protein